MQAAHRASRRAHIAGLFALALVLPSGGAADAPELARTRPPYGRQAALLPLRVDAHAGMTWDGGLGLGARAEFPLVTSFRYAPRDELALSVGTDMAFLWIDGSRRTETYPSVALQWALGVSDRFAFVPELGVAVRLEDRSWDKLVPSLAFGARYYLQRSFGLSFRLGWPFALSAGTIF